MQPSSGSHNHDNCVQTQLCGEFPSREKKASVSISCFLCEDEVYWNDIAVQVIMKMLCNLGSFILVIKIHCCIVWKSRLTLNIYLIRVLTRKVNCLFSCLASVVTTYSCVWFETSRN